MNAARFEEATKAVDALLRKYFTSPECPDDEHEGEADVIARAAIQAYCQGAPSGLARQLAGRIKKARMQADPMMDDVAVALNCAPTCPEIASAEIVVLAIRGLGYSIVEVPDGG